MISYPHRITGAISSLVRRILRNHMLIKLSCPGIFSHYVLLLFYLFREKKELLSGFPPMYQNKLQEERVQDVVDINKMKFEPYGDLVYQTISQFNKKLINNQDPHNQTKSNEILGTEYSNENDSEERKTNKNSLIPNFKPQIFPDDEIAEGINSLNSK